MAIFLLLSACLLFPSWLMVSNSFSPAKAFLRNPPRLLPYTFTFDNYRRALTLPWLPRWIANTLLLAAVLIVGGVLINGAAGYAFWLAQARWLRGLFWAFMAPIFVTRYVLIIAQFIIIGKLGLSGLAAVVSMSMFWATGIYLFRNYFRSIPMSIIESARMDGAGEWT
ncbi:MAG: hypothetical protein ABIH03_05285, partial [Pseudomonadota bacterium]